MLFYQHELSAEARLGSAILSEPLFVLFVCFDSLCPINNLSVTQGQGFLG